MTIESRLVVAEEVFALFPELRVGALFLDGVDNSGDGFASRLAKAQADVATELATVELANEPRIRCWREAYRAFGAKPKKYRSSIESLIRGAIAGEPLRSVNPLVDLGNYVSLTHRLPVGGEDLDAIDGDLVLRLAGEGEPAVKLLGESEPRAPAPGEVHYADANGAVCRRWNWREAERTKLTASTRRAVFVIEAIPPISAAELNEALTALSDLVRDHLGGSRRCVVLDASSPSS